MRIALFQPDIPQNTGTILRLAACFGIEAHIVEPAGFPTTDRAFRRAGMDYLDHVTIRRHPSWRAFEEWRCSERARLILLTTQATRPYLEYRFEADDILLFGRESSGVPQEVHKAADASLLIPMQGGLRSLNVSMTVAMAVGEALRQTRRIVHPIATERDDAKSLQERMRSCFEKTSAREAASARDAHDFMRNDINQK